MSALSQKIRINDVSLQIVHQREHFGEQGTPDTRWIPTLGSEGDWIVISGDLRIRTSLKERIAWLESGLTIFFMQKSFPRADEWDQALWLIRAWKNIIATAAANPTRSGFVVHQKGQIETIRMDELRSTLVRDRERVARGTMTSV